jgi:hypothetical protein
VLEVRLSAGVVAEQYGGAIGYYVPVSVEITVADNWGAKGVGSSRAPCLY